jgi:uncharacterized 2Fe-2S/4Fe-4S cluster protein (DUF4445 family)
MMRKRRSGWPKTGCCLPPETVGSLPSFLRRRNAKSMDKSHGDTAVDVAFLPTGKRVTATLGARLLEAARQNDVRISADCGGRGRCQSCAVRIEGNVPEPTPSDHAAFTQQELEAGWRKACQARLTGSCTVHLPLRTQVELVSYANDERPQILPIEEPVLVPDDEPGFWRRGNQRVGPIDGGQALGLAVDLGTTSIAGALINLATGQVVCAATVENPQLAYSADVIGRMAYALDHPEGSRQMQRLAVEAATELARRLTEGRPDRVAEVAVVGNSVMQHLLLGLPLATLARAPYRPHTLDEAELPAATLGFPFAPGAWLHFGPNIAAFIGSDHAAALLEIFADPPPSPWMMIDIGTNTEISLFANGELHSVSCASGPAFEGGVLSCGMRAAPGAISKVRLESGRVALETIDSGEPAGICGTGVVSLLSEMLRDDVVNHRGRLELSHPLVRDREGAREFLLDAGNGGLPIVFTQSDVRAVQLAKAAIRTGIDMLLTAAGVHDNEVERYIVAGAFGNFLDLEAAARIGLLPSASGGRTVQIGNAAGAGVRRMLVCLSARRRASQLARRANYLNLAAQPGFAAHFARRSLF